MTRVDFYVLPPAEDTGPVLLACKLCDKALQGEQKVFVHAPDAGLRNDLDSALWTSTKGSFLPHGLAEDEPDDADITAILLGAGKQPPGSHQDILINLSTEVPDFFSRFERVLEIVHGDDQARAVARERFGYYRDRGYELKTHKL